MEQFNQDKLLHDFVSGKEKAFNVVFYDYYEPLYHRCLFIIREEVAAGDIARDALVKVWQNRDKVQNYPHLVALLFTNALNLSLNYVRNERTRIETFYDVPPEGWTSDLVSNPITYNNVLQTIHDEIAGMNSEDQLIAELLIFQQLKSKEIAELLNKNKNTMQNKTAYIFKRLKVALIGRDLPVWF